MTVAKMCAIIKVITRDRTSAYAKAIAEELPDAMQVADRFRIHHKKIVPDIDNSSNYWEGRYKMIFQIRQLLKACEEKFSI